VCVCVLYLYEFMSSQKNTLSEGSCRLKPFIQKDKIYFLKINCFNNLSLISNKIFTILLLNIN